jgi:hypothetical protein
MSSKNTGISLVLECRTTVFARGKSIMSLSIYMCDFIARHNHTMVLLSVKQDIGR